MKINFNFTLDSFQADALLNCIQKEIVNLTDAKLDHLASKPHIDHLNGLIKYHETLKNIVNAGSNKVIDSL
jgi:hypothetical protein